MTKTRLYIYRDEKIGWEVKVCPGVIVQVRGDWGQALAGGLAIASASLYPDF